jgi:hypothetical protein
LLSMAQHIGEGNMRFPNCRNGCHAGSGHPNRNQAK